MIPSLWIYIIAHLSKPLECAAPGVNVNYGLWVIIMCQCSRFFNCNKCPALVGDAGRGEAVSEWGCGAHEN